MPAIVVPARDSRFTVGQRDYVEQRLVGPGKNFVGIKKIEAVVEALLRRFKEKTKNHCAALLQKASGTGEIETVISLAADGEPEIQYRDQVMELPSWG